MAIHRAGICCQFQIDLCFYIYRMQIKQLHSEATNHVYLDNVTVCKLFKQFQLPVDCTAKVRATNDKS